MIEKAVSNKNGKANFYIENLTGQNNSLLNDYKGFDYVLKNSGVSAKKQTIEVDTITLDNFIEQEYPNEKVDFIKIDIEGAELFALQGMKETIKFSSPTFMIEVSENAPEIIKMFHELNYIIISPQKSIITPTNYKSIFFDDTKDIIGSTENVFCISNSNHKLLKKLNIKLS